MSKHFVPTTGLETAGAPATVVYMKPYVRYKEGAEMFCMGERTFMDLAKEAGVVRKIKGVCLVNVELLKEYIETMYS